LHRIAKLFAECDGCHCDHLKQDYDRFGYPRHLRSRYHRLRRYARSWHFTSANGKSMMFYCSYL